MFSPLALTQTLPFLPLAQGDIDYQVARRGDPDLFDTLFADPVTKVILVRGGLLAVPRGQGNAVNYASANMRLSTLPGAYAGSALAVHPEVVPIFLGSYGALRNEHVVALDITRMSTPARPRRFLRRRSVPTRRLMPTAMLPVRSRLTGWTCWNRPWNGSTGWICAGSPRTPTPARPDRPRPR